ncbi:MAG TPA: tetratricopeptide repeat protein [Pyrinomonadaceae bacterium]|jgi:tetratricopeptide (TPR) repeat protein|nr:tetratricopeptide repeat protein [Pyrinomonadaceae bacterium]
MKIKILSVASIILLLSFVSVVFSQTEGGGGGHAGNPDPTFKPRTKPVVRRTAPRRIVPKKTTAEYEAEGDSYYSQKDFDSAIAAYESAAKIKPSYHALYRLGWIYNDREDYDEALRWLGQATGLTSNPYDAYVEIGYAYRKLGNANQAMTAYQKALQYKPSGSSALFGIGDVYFEISKKYDTAGDYYRQGLAIDPDDATALYRLGYAYNDTGQYTQAIDLLNRSRQLKPDWVINLNELGYAYKQLKRYNDAINVLRQAVAKNNDSELAHYYLGEVYVLIGNRSGANNEYRELQRLNSDYSSKLIDLINKM